MADSYNDYSREELIRELRLRDRRPRFGLVWERKEIDHEKAVNDDFVTLEFDPFLSCGAAPNRNLIIESDNFDIDSAKKIEQDQVFRVENIGHYRADDAVQLSLHPGI